MMLYKLRFMSQNLDDPRTSVGRSGPGDVTAIHDHGQEEMISADIFREEAAIYYDHYY